MSRTRLAPADLEKTRKIPRLELLGCLFGIRLFKYARNALKNCVDVSKVMFWSNSSIALHWIGKDPQKLKKFISNRVKEIREHSQPEQWRHLPGELNVCADVASRGCNMRELIELKAWWQGPDILRQGEEKWETIPKVVEISKLSQEEKQAIQEEEAVAETDVFVTIDTESWWRIILDSFEFLQRSIRVIALVLRAIRLFKENEVQFETSLISQRIKRLMPNWQELSALLTLGQL